MSIYTSSSFLHEIVNFKQINQYMISLYRLSLNRDKFMNISVFTFPVYETTNPIIIRFSNVISEYLYTFFSLLNYYFCTII